MVICPDCLGQWDTQQTRISKPHSIVFIKNPEITPQTLPSLVSTLFQASLFMNGFPDEARISNKDSSEGDMWSLNICREFSTICMNPGHILN